MICCACDARDGMVATNEALAKFVKFRIPICYLANGCLAIPH